MNIQLSLDGDLSRDILREFAKYIVPFIRQFADSAEGKQYITEWIEKNPEYDREDDCIYDYDDEDDDY